MNKNKVVRFYWLTLYSPRMQTVRLVMQLTDIPPPQPVTLILFICLVNGLHILTEVNFQDDNLRLIQGG